MRATRPTTHSVWLGVLVLLLLAAAMQPAVEARRPPAILENGRLLLPSAGTLSRLALHYNGLLADVYWTRAIQYFGERHQTRQRSFPLLLPLLNLTLDLDPDLTQVAQYGSYFLADKVPLGAGEPQGAIALLQRAIARQPDNWRLYYNLGFVYALNLHDRQKAAEAFYRGSLRPNAHPALKVLAAAFLQGRDERQLARALWSELYETSPDPLIRANARDHLEALQAEADIEHWQALIGDYARRTGRAPADWTALGLASPPRDPEGRAYHLTAGGRVELDPATAIASFQSH
ncbi:MAG: tetratricopeptide repeat protein [Terriglobales bacterium]